MLHVQEFLRSRYNSLEALKEDQGIKVHSYDHYVLLDYDQIKAPKTDPITIECRSLILDIHTWGVASRKFDRFFNYGEAPDALVGFNFNRSLVLEKVDGSLCGVWWNSWDARWEISTRGTAFAEGPHVFGGTFRDHIIKAFGFDSEHAFQQLMFSIAGRMRDYTFVFEYYGPENKIVTTYPEAGMSLLGITHMDGSSLSWDLCLEMVRVFRTYGCHVTAPKVYDHRTSLSEMVEVANELENLQEGFVVWDPISNKRVKIKSATYLVAHRLRGNDVVPTRKNLLGLVFDGEVDEFLAYFPEWAENIKEIQGEVDEFRSQLDVEYRSAIKVAGGSQKEFALHLQAHVDPRMHQFMYKAKARRISPSEVFDQTDVARKVKVFLKE